MSPEYTLEIWQDGMIVASVTGTEAPVVWAEAWHYVSLYQEDGTVEIRGDVGVCFAAADKQTN